MKRRMAILAAAAGVMAAVFALAMPAGGQTEDPRTMAPERVTRGVSGATATWVCPFEAFELQSLAVVGAQGPGTSVTGAFAWVTAPAAGSVTNPVSLPALAAAGTTNALDHTARWVATNAAAAVTMFYRDELRLDFGASGSNGLWLITGNATLRK